MRTVKETILLSLTLLITTEWGTKVGFRGLAVAANYEAWRPSKEVGIILEINYNGLYKVQFFNNLSKRYWVVKKYLQLISES